jgi:hypothetical protein
LSTGLPLAHTPDVSPLAEFNDAGELPPGVYPASLGSVLTRFGSGSARRRATGERLRRIYTVAAATGQLARFIVFGSFITDTPAPNDVDVFLLMADTFDADGLRGEAAILFEHTAAQTYFGASVFWMRRLAALGGEATVIEHWQIKRDGTRRGIVEVVTNDSE